jgi:hypothetical protein
MILITQYPSALPTAPCEILVLSEGEASPTGGGQQG